MNEIYVKEVKAIYCDGNDLNGMAVVPRFPPRRWGKDRTSQVRVGERRPRVELAR